MSDSKIVSSTSTVANDAAAGKNGNDLEAQKQAGLTPEKQNNHCEETAAATGEEETPPPSDEMEDNSNVPRLSLPSLFWFFFTRFGLLAFGGPVAQIALIKDRLVMQDAWITLERFQRVFAVYQILPGPEAAELCMF